MKLEVWLTAGSTVPKLELCRCEWMFSDVFVHKPIVQMELWNSDNPHEGGCLFAPSFVRAGQRNHVVLLGPC